MQASKVELLQDLVRLDEHMTIEIEFQYAKLLALSTCSEISCTEVSQERESCTRRLAKSKP